MPKSRIVEPPETPATPVSSFRSDSGNLDLIRAAAVMSVFFAHLHQFVSGAPSVLGWHFAQMGVLVFFVHTSMVLMLSLERTKQQGAAKFAAFYLRRFFRLYPLSIACVTMAMVFHISPDVGAPDVVWTWPQYLSNLALTTNLTSSKNMVGGLWTLPLEVQMYLALPFLFVLGGKSGVAGLFLVWLFLLPLGLIEISVTGRLNVISYAPCFVAGVIAWRLSLTVRRRFSGWLWPLAFVATWPVFFAAKHESHLPFRWAFCLALGLLIPWFEELRFKPINRLAHFCAKYSYGIYLSHWAIMVWVFATPWSWMLRWIVFIPIALITPVAIFHLIENPMILVGQRLATRLWPPIQAPAKPPATTVAL